VYNKRVAVVDFDVHHGNGTEAILKERYSKELGSTVMFASIHLYEAFEDSSLDFFPGTGGGDAAAAGIINIPIQPLWARHRWRCCSHGDQKQPDKVASAGSSSKESEAASAGRSSKESEAASAGRSSKESEAASAGSSSKESEAASAGSSSKESEAALKAVGGPTKSGGTIRSGRGGWRDGISKRLLPALRSFRPEIILVSAGFDGASGDEGNTQDEISGRCP
jgi:hypothetical protein